MDNYIKFGSTVLQIPPVMLATDKNGNKRLIKTTTKKTHTLKVFNGKPAITLINNSNNIKVKKVKNTSIIMQYKNNALINTPVPRSNVFHTIPNIQQNSAASKIQGLVRGVNFRSKNLPTLLTTQLIENKINSRKQDYASRKIQALIRGVNFRQKILPKLMYSNLILQRMG